MDLNSHMHFRIAAKIRDAFYRRCGRNHTVPSEVARKLLQQYARGNITDEQLNPPKKRK